MATTEAYDGEIVTELLEPIESASTLMALNSSEIDMQIATAKRFPRSIKLFTNEALQMVTLSEEIAGECIYSLPRGGKPIEGPSARFAEIVLSAWGNVRAGARVIGEDEKFVTSQGAFYDLQRNVHVSYEVKRRITDKNNKKFKDDMVGVTSNAACSIALRNAILKGIPKAFWKPLYDAARATAIGTAETLSGKRAKMVDAFAKMGVQPEQIFKLLGIAGVQDITLDHIATLRGTFTALKEGDTTIEQIFEEAHVSGSKASKSKLNDKLDEQTPGSSITASDVLSRIEAETDPGKIDQIRIQYTGPDSEGSHLDAAEWTQIVDAAAARIAAIKTPAKLSTRQKEANAKQGDLLDKGQAVPE